MTTFTSKMLIVPAAFALGLFGLSTEAKANTWDHVDQTALKLQHDVEELHDEAHDHFRNTPVFRAFDQTVEQMEKLAVHIHDLNHTGASIRHLSNDVRQLDRLQHQAEQLYVTMARWGQLDQVAYRHLGDTLRATSLSIRHLRNDLRQLEHDLRFGTPGGYPHGPIGAPVIRPGGVQVFPQAVPNHGFEVRRGGFNIRVGIHQ